jgi:hypothetical protein
MHEQLVILDAAQADRARTEIERVAAVTQSLPPRLLLISAVPPDVLAALRRVPGVVEVVDGASAVATPGFSHAERLFVDAWVARDIPKTRRGDGSPWDEKGFEPPDVPDGSARRDGNAEPFEG